MTPADDDVDDSQSTCDVACVVGITVAIVAVLLLVSIGWLSGRLTRIGCPSPLKKRARTNEHTVEYPAPISEVEKNYAL